MKEKHVSEVRAFNRFYTPLIGLMDKYILHSRFSLPEVRVLHELYHHDSRTSTDMIRVLGIDKGYLSRVVKNFERKKLLAKKRAGHDSRAINLFLTATGKKEFESLNEASNRHIRSLLEHLNEEQCSRLVGHMAEIKKILSAADQS